MFVNDVNKLKGKKVTKCDPKVLLSKIWSPWLLARLHQEVYLVFYILYAAFMVKNTDNSEGKPTKSFSNFEIKQPNFTILFIFVFKLSFIDCILSKIVGFDQLWTAFQQKLVTANRKLAFFKMPNTFSRFTVQNCHYFLPC